MSATVSSPRRSEETQRPRPRPAAATQSWDPLLRPVAWLVLSLSLILNSGALGGITGVLIPNSIPLLVGLAAVGLSPLLRRDEPVVLAMGATVLLGVALASVLWSHQPPATILWLRSYALVTLGIVALVTVLPERETIAVIRQTVRLVLFISIVAVSIDPFARIHIDASGEAPPLKGWHAFFIHKNTMAVFLVFAVASVIEFEKNRAIRWASYVAILVLLVGSDSTSGRASVLVLVAFRIWTSVNRRLTTRSSAAFIASSAAFAMVAALGVFASISAIAEAAGKDLSLTGRTDIWGASWRAVLREPIIGHGIGGLFSIPRSAETLVVVREIGFPAGHPHNGFLDAAIQLGVVGVILVAAVVVSVIRAGIRQQTRTPAISAWSLGVMVGLLMLSVGESVYLGSSIAVFAMLRVLQLRSNRAAEEELAYGAAQLGHRGSARYGLGERKREAARRRAALRRGSGARSTPTRRTPTTRGRGTGTR